MVLLKMEAEDRGFQRLPVAPAYVSDTEKNIFDHDNCINSTQCYKNNENIWALFSTLLSLPCIIHVYRNPRFRPLSAFVIFVKHLAAVNN